MPNYEQKKYKVICVGFQKTGTSTMGLALKELGYNVLNNRLELADDLITHNYVKAYEYMDSYNAFQDNPWPLLYKEFDKRYSNCKFILTIRNENNWIKSVLNHFGSRNSKMRQWIYGKGIPKGNESIYIEKYLNHNQTVRTYFKDRKKDLLILELEKGEYEWEKICNFLDEPIPSIPFPHANRGSYTFLEKVKKKVRRYFIR